VQFTPDLLPADITGTYVLNPKDGTFSLRAGPIFANVLLADEINRAPAKTQSALLEAMQERAGHDRRRPLRAARSVLRAGHAEPVDLEGTYPLPEAQIDRFLVRVPMGYPNERDEVQMLTFARHHRARTVRRAFGSRRACSFNRSPRVCTSKTICMSTPSRSARFTRNHPRVLLGASPRASLGLLRAAKSHAVLSGRPFVTPDDVRVVAAPVLGHRLI